MQLFILAISFFSIQCQIKNKNKNLLQLFFGITDVINVIESFLKFIWTCFFLLVQKTLKFLYDEQVGNN